MEPVTTTTRIWSAFFKVCAGTSVVLLVVAAVGPAFTAAEDVLVYGFPISFVLALLALVAQLRAPRRLVVLLDVIGDQLYVRSRADPFNDIGRSYRPALNIPVASLRKIESTPVYLSRLGEFFIVDFTRRDDTTEIANFKPALQDAIREFLRELAQKWPHIEVVDARPTTRINSQWPFPLRLWPRGSR